MPGKKRKVRKTAKKKSFRKKAKGKTPGLDTIMERKLAWEREMRGLTNLANKLTLRELVQLRKAHFHVEGIQKSKLVFRKIAKNQGVSSGDLEQALAIRLGLKIQKKKVKTKRRPDKRS